MRKLFKLKLSANHCTFAPIDRAVVPIDSGFAPIDRAVARIHCAVFAVAIVAAVGLSACDSSSSSNTATATDTSTKAVAGVATGTGTGTTAASTAARPAAGTSASNTASSVSVNASANTSVNAAANNTSNGSANNSTTTSTAGSSVAASAASGLSIAQKNLIQAKYQPYFDSVYSTHASSFDAMVASGNGRRYYDMSYVHAAHLNMYEATADRKYLERSLSWMEAQIGLANNSDAAGRRNWSADPNDGETRFGPTIVPYLLYDLQSTIEFARLARLVLTTAALKTSYGNRAQAIYDFVRINIVDKWLVDRKSIEDTAAYWTTNADPVKNRTYWIDDRTMMAARILMDLDKVTPSPRYSALYSTLLNGMKARLVSWSPPGPAGTITWDQKRVGFELGFISAPDTAHGNRHVLTMIEAYRNGVVFSKSDVQGLGKLFAGVMWNKSVSDPLITNFVDGSNAGYRTYPPYGNGAIYFGWEQLGAWEPQVQSLCDAVLDAIIAGRSNPTVAYNASEFGRLGLAASLSRNLVVSAQGL